MWKNTSAEVDDYFTAADAAGSISNGNGVSTRVTAPDSWWSSWSPPATPPWMVGFQAPVSGDAGLGIEQGLEAPGLVRQ
jgi:hypothetical protein